MKISVLIQPLQMIGSSACRPRITERAMAAPAYPPKSACEELVGRPSHQVSRSQAIAPASPARIT